MDIDFFHLILLIGGLGWVIVFASMFLFVVWLFVWGLPGYLVTRGEKKW